MRKTSFVVDMVEKLTDNRFEYLVLPLADTTLHDVISHHRPLPSEVIKIISAQMILGIETIHQKKIVHLDIKPLNILITNWNVTIADFGGTCEVFEDIFARRSKKLLTRPGGKIFSKVRNKLKNAITSNKNS